MFNFLKSTNDTRSILKKVQLIEKNLEKNIVQHQKDAIARYPFTFLGLSTIGGVAVFQGFEKIIARSQYLADRPLVVMLMGFLILIATGALYKKLNSL